MGGRRLWGRCCQVVGGVAFVVAWIGFLPKWASLVMVGVGLVAFVGGCAIEYEEWR